MSEWSELLLFLFILAYFMLPSLIPFVQSIINKPNEKNNKELTQ